MIMPDCRYTDFRDSDRLAVAPALGPGHRVKGYFLLVDVVEFADDRLKAVALYLNAFAQSIHDCDLATWNVFPLFILTSRPRP
jgi:hypothetical protein